MLQMKALVLLLAGLVSTPALAVDNETFALSERASGMTAFENIGASLLLVAQNSRGGAGDSSQMSARADLEVELPGGSIGTARGRLFGHFRAGNGDGVDAGAFATSNATAFNFARPVLMQAWYQLDIPVGGASGGRGQVEVTLGKIDPFGFFDGNNVAEDESEQFLNLAFIHNPLLDAGGDIGVGEHGASPGLRVAYVSDSNGGNHVTATLGLFGAGEDADYVDIYRKPLVIGQLEYAGKPFAGLAGAYRLYVWSNGRAADPSGNDERHRGWGISVDQQVADHITLFSRIGVSTEGETAFDRACTLGVQFDGNLWGRVEDRIGLAAGWLDGGAEAETPVELYYAWQINDLVQVAPSLQWIGNPGGVQATADVTALNLRVKASF